MLTQAAIQQLQEHPDGLPLLQQVAAVVVLELTHLIIAMALLVVQAAVLQITMALAQPVLHHLQDKATLAVALLNQHLLTEQVVAEALTLLVLQAQQLKQVMVELELVHFHRGVSQLERVKTCPALTIMLAVAVVQVMTTTHRLVLAV
jgi:hypothetical protein